MRAEGALCVSGDYFGIGRDGYPDPLKAPQVTRRLGTSDLPHRNFVWSISSVVSAVLDADLTIRSLREFPDPEMYPGLGDRAASMPATYVLIASR